MSRPLAPERIVVVMPNWFGEALFVTPFLRVLREACPQAYVAGLGVPRCQDVLAHNPHLDEFLVYDERGIHRGLSAKRPLIATLRSRRFDTAFILRRSLSRTALIALAKIPRRIGFANWKSGWLLTDRIPVPSTPIHKAHAYLHLLKPLGVSATPRCYEYYPSHAERAWASAWLREQGLANGRPIVVLHPGANWPHKRWHPERFAELTNSLGRRTPLTVVITGGPEDQAFVQSILARSVAQPVVLAGHTTLRQLAACLERADLVVSNDTGVLHIACALGRPVVGLYGPTSPAITGPLGDPGRIVVLHHPDCCPSIPCYQPDRPPHPGMEAISVEEVLDAAEKLLSQTGDMRRET